MFKMFQLKVICNRSCYFPLQIFSRCATIKYAKRHIPKRHEKVGNPTNFAQLIVIGSGAPDQPASVILKAQNKNYLFNCGDGIRPLSGNVKVNLSNINHAFFTQSKWNCIGGMTSVIHSTISETGFLPTVHGPTNLNQIFRRMSFLSIVGGVFKNRFTPEIFKSDEQFEDDNLVIEPIQLKHFKDTAFIYVCKLKACKGSLSLGKSVEINVPPHLIPNLNRGEDVVLEDGCVVTPNDVKYPDSPEVHFIVADVPHTGYLYDMATNKMLKKLYEKAESTGIELIIHFTPKDVFHTERYQYFIKSINSKRNMIVNDMNTHSNLLQKYLLQKKLNTIDSRIHPLLSMKLDTSYKTFDPYNKSSKTDGNEPTFYNKYILRGVNELNSVKKDVADDGISDEESESFRMVEAIDTKSEKFQLHTQNVPLKLKDEKFPRILFLGTGASDSFFLRSSSAILVHLSKDAAILLDCGSGTCSQINRFYGDETPEVYRRLKAVYVSHMHLDHHIGLPDLLRCRQRYLPISREQLRIFCPLEDFKSWILFYGNHIDSLCADIKFIDNDDLLDDKFSRAINARERLYLNINSIKTCAVEHYKKSYALAMSFSYRDGDKVENFRLAYSGDTGLSDDFVKLGYKADLLIHEATFQNVLRDLADKFRHSTISMALEQSKKMQAKHTILTHFSSRYHIIPYIEDLDENAGLAFDFMEVTLDDLPKLHSLVEQYHKAFPGAMKILERKKMNYHFQRGLDTPINFE